ncbi:MAG: hypothetical protein AAGC47_06060 [Bacteroidota bacterium]
MNRGTVIQMIESGHIPNGSDFEDIKTLAQKYPYCSTFKVLQAMGAKESDELEMKEYINIASIYIQDRSKLYDHVVRDRLLKKIEEESSEEEEVMEVQEAEIDLQSAPIDEDPLEQQIMAAAVMQLGELEVGTYVETAQPEQPNSAEPEVPVIKKPSSLSEFLTAIDRSSQKPERAIIDKFVSEDRKIAPVKKAFFSPAQMGKMSLMEDESFVTETLAKIYEKQGDYKKAARAYKNLSLKYPEKRLYFADLQKQAEEHL